MKIAVITGDLKQQHKMEHGRKSQQMIKDDGNNSSTVRHNEQIPRKGHQRLKKREREPKKIPLKQRETNKGNA